MSKKYELFCDNEKLNILAIKGKMAGAHIIINNISDNDMGLSVDYTIKIPSKTPVGLREVDNFINAVLIKEIKKVIKANG